MSWFRKHRPASVAQLDLVSVRETLGQMMSQANIPQVMIFAGPKGTGKTSSARIIASVLNDPANQALTEHLFLGKAKPKLAKFAHPNSENELIKKILAGRSFAVQELDAASNRGIDDIRALKEKVSLPPTEGIMTVYILDEVHMLTTEAFNALLKLLEEPPSHVVFILATTEKNKVPATVLSRCTLVQFRKATSTELVEALQRVVKAEKLDCPADVLQVIAAQADGSFRDAVKLLEMITPATKKLTVELAQSALQVVESKTVIDLLQAVLDKDERLVVQIFALLRSQQVNEQALFKQILEFLHQQLKISLKLESGKTFGQVQVITYLLKQLLAAQLVWQSAVPLLGLEVFFLDLVFRAQKQQKSSGDSGTADHSSSLSKKIKITRPAASDTGLKSAETLPLESEVAPINKGDAHKLLKSWSSFIQAVSEKQSAIGMLLRTARPLKTANNEATIGVYYPFHKERLEDKSTQQLLQNCLEPFVGGRVKLNFALATAEPVLAAAELSDLDQLPELAKEALL